MKANKDIYADKCKEELALKEKIKNILLNKKTVGSAANEIIYLLHDEVRKANVK